MRSASQTAKILPWRLALRLSLDPLPSVPNAAICSRSFGLALSFVAYVLRYDAARWRSIVGPTGLMVLVTAAVAFVGLRGIAMPATQSVATAARLCRPPNRAA